MEYLIRNNSLFFGFVVLFIYTTLGLYHVIMLQFFNPAGPRWSPDSCCPGGGAAPCSPLDTVQHYGMHIQRDIQHNNNNNNCCFFLDYLGLMLMESQNCYLPSLRNHRWWTDSPTNVVTHGFWATLLSLTGASNFSVSHWQTTSHWRQKMKPILRRVEWCKQHQKKGGERLYPFFMLMQRGAGGRLYLTPLRCYLQLNLLKCQVYPAGRGKIRI